MSIDADCGRLIKHIYHHVESVITGGHVHTGKVYEILAVLKADAPGLIPYQEPFGCVAHDHRENRVIVAFRGTQTFEDWIANADTHQNRQGVHAGFYYLYRQMEEEMLDAVQTIKDRQPQAGITITGHSLGGAMSPLAGLALEGYHPEVITFAAPRTGSPEFARLVDSRIDVIRWVNTEDIVPTLPTPILGGRLYQHVGRPVCFTENLGSTIANHDIDTYLKHCAG